MTPALPPRPYSDLNEDQIRLLSVDLSESGSHELLTVDIDQPPEYTALSYVWGPQTNQEEISVNSLPFTISRNLSSALKAIIETNFENRKRLHMWIDQICINQNDDEEKSQQVRLMSVIYRSAQDVLVWLPLAPGIRGGDEVTLDVWLSLHLAAASVDSDTDEEYGYQLNETMSDAHHLAWSNVVAIVESPWWTRAWIYQEFILGKKATFLVDGLAFPSEVLEDLLMQFRSRLRYHEGIEWRYRETRNRYLRKSHPWTHLIRCSWCRQPRGTRWLRSLSREPAIWLTAVLCVMCIFQPIMILFTVARGLGRTSSAGFDSDFGEEKGTCDCDNEDLEERVFLNLPSLDVWRQMEYSRKWFLAVCRDSSCWLGFSILGLTLLSEQAANNPWTMTFSLMTAFLGPLTALPDIDYNNQVLASDLVRRPKFSSWRSMEAKTWRSWDLVVSMFKQRAKRNDLTPLSALIEHARCTRSTDPRDKVYAFLGCLNSPSYTVDILYAKSKKVREVLTETAEQIISVERNLNLLVLAIDDRSSRTDSIHLPSWVPNWSRPRILHSEETRREKIFVDSPYAMVAQQASKDRPAETSFYTSTKGKQILRAKGIYIDTLHSNLKGLRPSRRYKGRHSGFEFVATVKPVLRGDEVWVLLGSDTPLILRNDAVAKVFGDAVNGFLASMLFTRGYLWIRKLCRGRAMYKLVGEAAILTAGGDGRGDVQVSDIHRGAVIDAMDRGKVSAEMVDIC